MGRGQDDELSEIFDRAARVRGPRDRALALPGVSWAHAILDARREGKAAEPCPPAIVRRVTGWFAARPRGGAARLLALVRDSGVMPAIAARGAGRTPRLLRCAAGGTTVDLEVRRSAKGGLVHVAVHPALPGVVMEARTAPGGARRRVRLDEAACGVLRVSAEARRLSVVFRVGAAPAFRIRDLPLT